MDRRTRTFIVMGVALVAATVASLSVYRAIRRIPVRQVEVAHDYVVLAARPIPLGTRLAASDVKRVGWPSSSPLQGGFPRIEDVVGRGVITDVGANEPLTEAKLAPKEAGAGLSPAIPPGMRAISVKVNEVIGVAGFVVPGTRVDVVVTIGQREDSVSRVIVSNVQVLTAGTKMDQDQAKDGKPMPSTVVTLLVTPTDAERIALASAEGSIMLTLRNPMDASPTETKGTRLAALMGAPEPVPVIKVARGVRRAEPPPQPPPVPVPTVYSVETIRAAKRVNEVVK